MDAEVVSNNRPMTYEYYHQVKGGKSPKTAPTYAGPAGPAGPVANEQTSQKESERMSKYKCKICGYIYDPSEGDPDGDIAAGTPFADLPDSWVCPMCGAAKTEFEKTA